MGSEKPAWRKVSGYKLILPGLFVLALLRGVPFWSLAPVLGIPAFLWLWKTARASDARGVSRVSWRWSLLFLVGFQSPVVAGGHGVAPFAYVLLRGWGVFPVPVTLGWMAMLVVLASPWVPLQVGRMLALIGALLALGAWLLIEARSEELLLVLPFSLPFFASLVLFLAHLPRTPAPKEAT